MMASYYHFIGALCECTIVDHCDHSIQAMSSTKRLMVYTVPVTMISFALNIPKFFEVTLNDYNGTEVVNEDESRREPTFVFW